LLPTLLFLFCCLLSTCWGQPSHLYGLWYCGDDACNWAVEPNLNQVQWIINRGDGKPTANVVIFAFLDPLALLQRTNNANFVNGVPKGMTNNVVQFFKSHGIAVMFSIGGEEFSSDGKWNQALSDPVTLAKNAAAISKSFGVGIEIDYENDSSTYLSALDQFVQAYRSIIPSSGDSASYLTVDMGAGTGYLTGVSKMATQWLNSSKINWANAMVTGSPYGSLGDATQYWQQHLDGANWAGIPPMRPSTLVISLYSSSGSKNCHSFDGTVLQGALGWVSQKSARGIFFWACGCPAPNSCVQNCEGIQQGSKQFI